VPIVRRREVTGFAQQAGGAWAGDLAEPELPGALATWFGPPAVA